MYCVHLRGCFEAAFKGGPLIPNSIHATREAAFHAAKNSSHPLRVSVIAGEALGALCEAATVCSSLISGKCHLQTPPLCRFIVQKEKKIVLFLVFSLSSGWQYMRLHLQAKSSLSIGPCDVNVQAGYSETSSKIVRALFEQLSVLLSHLNAAQT